jgi:phage terminase large subunit-like protein
MSPNIPVAAASFEQADRLFGAAKTMATEGPLAPCVEAYDTEILLKDRPGRMYRVAAVAGTNDGTLPTCFIADEVHEWQGRKERVHLVIGNSLAKRAGGLELNITTPDDADPESLLGRLRAYGEKVASGEITDPGFLYEHWTASPDWNLDDPGELRKAIREATPASWLSVEAVAARYEVDRIPVHEFRRYHLAQFVRAGVHWLPEGAWEKRAVDRQAPDAETDVVLAFDGSYRGDSTALVGCTLDGHLFVLGAWENPGDDPEWRVPREEVKAYLAEAMRFYRVRELAPDPFGWHGEVEEWEETYGATVVRFETNLRKRMAQACSRFYTAVSTGQLTHDGDPRLARHLRNSVPKETPQGVLITKDAPTSSRKIDLAVAAVVAYERAAWHAGQQPSEPLFAVT